MLKIHHIAAAAAIALASTAADAAPTVVDTGTPTSPVGYAGYYPLFTGQSLAGQFTLTQNVTIDQVQGWILALDPATLDVSIYTDSGALPGAALYTASFTPTVLSPLAYQWSGPGSLAWNLTPGTYWVVFSSSSISGVDLMANTAPSPIPGAYRTSTGTWSSDTNLGIGIRVFGDASAVPEPATWAMMLVGFAAIGWTMRRNRTRALASAS